MSIAIVDPSGQPDDDALKRNIAALEQSGIKCSFIRYCQSHGDRLGIQGISARLAILEEALSNHEVIVCARGGYGASDLISGLDYDHLKHLPERLVVGFSDICALHSALYAQLGWRGIHGPMPGSTLWQTDGPDVAALIEIIENWPEPSIGRLSVAPAVVPGLAGSDPPQPHQYNGDVIEGKLFGGCLSVLSALVGTRYFPADLGQHILFLEDVNESVPQVLRAWNQWLQSGAMDGVSAVVTGCFGHRDPQERARLTALPELIQERSPVAVFQSTGFGHVSPNVPLMIGAPARIARGELQFGSRATDTEMAC
ncbi:MAG: putative carboxypeptidase [marine bacterium B5-7]|nr:MAG: putative carboxypeptidase [marine bacterium B5-7]